MITVSALSKIPGGLGLDLHCLMMTSRSLRTFLPFKTMFVRGYEFEGDFVYLAMFICLLALMKSQTENFPTTSWGLEFALTTRI